MPVKQLQQVIDSEHFAELMAYDNIEGLPHPVRETGMLITTLIGVNTERGKSVPGWRDVMGLKKAPVPFSALKNLRGTK